MTTAAQIVVGVDGSPASVEALRWGARQAALTHASLNAVIGWEYPTQYGNEYFGADVDWREVAQTILAGAVLNSGEGGPPVPCTQTVTEGHPAQVLTAASEGAELMVVGSRGHGAFAGMLLGSVSEHVAAHASCPVVVIRHAAAPEQERS